MRKTRTNDFRVWLVTARPGASYIYHRGLLCFDREPHIYQEDRGQMEEDVNDLGEATWQASEDGMVHLTQRRIGKNRFEYIATKRRAVPKNQRERWRD